MHKPIINKFKKCKVYSSFRDNIWGADLADMQLISKDNKGFLFLFCFNDIYGKYTWVVLLKDKGITITSAFQKIFHKSTLEKQKWNKKWRDKVSKFYNKSMKSRFVATT